MTASRSRARTTSSRASIRKPATSPSDRCPSRAAFSSCSAVSACFSPGCGGETHVKSLVARDASFAIARENKTCTMAALHRPQPCGIRGVADVSDRFAPSRREQHGQAEGIGRGARSDRARLRQGLDHEARLAPGARPTPRWSRPARSASTSRSASAACRAAASSRSTGRKARARRRWRSMSSPRRSGPAAPAPSSTPSTRSTPAMPRSSASISTSC